MEEVKKDKIQKDGVDYLIKQGYKKLSAKTFISDIDLERFLNKDFTNINKTRALGFIQILEREYDVDLDELRAEYLSHEIAHRPKKPETLFTETPIINDKEWQKYLPYAAAVLMVLGFAFYLFRPSIEIVQTPEPSVKQLEENKSIINEAEQNIANLEENENIVSVNSSIGNPLQKETNVSISSAAPMNDDLDLDKVVLQMMQDRNLSMKDLNSTIDLNSSSKIVKKEKVDQPKPAAEPVAIKPKVKKTTPKKKTITNGDLYIDPTQKAWVGIIYLDNFTKKDFLIRKKLPLDASRDQLIVVGHGRFKIYNKAYSVKFRGKGPIRFIYKDGELMEISKKEFKRTSAGVAW
jgi:hypothetical protein